MKTIPEPIMREGTVAPIPYPLPHPLPIEAVAQAYWDCRRRKRHTASAREFELALERNLVDLWEDLRNRTWRPGPASVFAVTHPKPREIWAASFRDRIVHHLVYRTIRPLFEPSFVADSCACIEGRGTLYAADRLDRHLRSATEGWTKPAFVLKADIANFFGSIDRAILFRRIARRVTDPFMLDLCRHLVFQDPRAGAVVRSARRHMALVPAHKSLFNAPEGVGLPIGNLSSQFFANIHLDPLDQAIKRRLGMRHYTRYVDDMAIVHRDPKRLAEAADEIRLELAALGLRLAERKTAIHRAEQGIDFVGTVLRPGRRSTRPKTHRNALHRIATLPRDRVAATANSYIGLCRHAGSRAQREALCRAALARGFRVDRDLTKVWSIEHGRS